MLRMRALARHFLPRTGSLAPVEVWVCFAEDDVQEASPFLMRTSCRLIGEGSRCGAAMLMRQIAGIGWEMISVWRETLLSIGDGVEATFSGGSARLMHWQVGRFHFSRIRYQGASCVQRSVVRPSAMPQSTNHRHRRSTFVRPCRLLPAYHVTVCNVLNHPARGEWNVHPCWPFRWVPLILSWRARRECGHD